MAFSQGACMAGILTSVLDSNQLKFLILFSGFKSRITKHDVYYEKKIDGVRSLHVYGATDEVIDPGLLSRHKHAVRRIPYHIGVY